MKITPAQHSILFDYNKQKKENGESTIKFDGKSYVIKGDEKGLTVRRENKTFSDKVADFFSRALHTSGRNSDFIRKTIQENQDFKFQEIPEFHGICFSGGGAKGLAYPGVIEQLGEDKLKAVQQVSGASAGSLFATMVALGLSAADIRRATLDQPETITNDALGKSIKGKITSALEKYVEFLHEKDDETLINHIKNGEVTFAELEKLRTLLGDGSGIKELMLSASYHNKNKGWTGEVKLSADTAPNMPIYKAAIASSTIPLPWIVKKTSLIKLEPMPTDKDSVPESPFGEIEGGVLRDGGIHNNLPFTYLKGDANNLILSFSENKGIHEKPLSTSKRIKEFFCGEPVYKRRQADHLYADKVGTFYLDPGIGTRDVKKGRENFEEINANASKQLDYFLLERSQGGQGIKTVDAAVEKDGKSADQLINAMKYA